MRICSVFWYKLPQQAFTPYQNIFFFIYSLFTMNTPDTIYLSAKLVGAGMATIGLVGAGVGVGVVFGSFLVSLSRNPFLRDELFRFAILGFALTEAVGLLALMMAFLILFR